MPLVSLLFSPRGRAPRSKYWLVPAFYVALLGGLLYAIHSASDDVTGHPDGIGNALYVPLVVAGVASYWSNVCLGIKRYHDLGRPWYWVLVQFVPVVGALLFLAEVGLRRGEYGPNQYGADPADRVTSAANLAAL